MSTINLCVLAERMSKNNKSDFRKNDTLFLHKICTKMSATITNISLQTPASKRLLIWLQIIVVTQPPL